tara:strand:+ start:180 stop:515 length:336 start_codon:yes stop_codon:yes gene_type:complete
MKKVLQLLKDSGLTQAVYDFVTSNASYRIGESSKKNGLNIFGIKAFNMADINQNYPDVKQLVDSLKSADINVSYLRDEKNETYKSGILYISAGQTDDDVADMLGMQIDSNS